MRKGLTNVCCLDLNHNIRMREFTLKKKKSSFAVGAGRTKTLGAVDIINLAGLMVPGSGWD